tara:strand:- start:471 stop:656 length:186 start_codon:yes stop_codon:yes gene_type:complete
LDYGHDGLVGLLYRLVRIDNVDEVICYRVKYLTAKLKRFPSLEFIPLPIADPDAGYRGIKR